jgi:hypothetical protein
MQWHPVGGFPSHMDSSYANLTQLHQNKPSVEAREMSNPRHRTPIAP